MKTKILNIAGASGAGKTTIANKLQELDKNINVIQSYTTRDKRYEGEEGHIFIDDMQENQLDDNKMDLISKSDGKIEVKIISKKDMIAHQILYGDHYFALEEQILKGQTNIYVIDPVGAEQVKEYYKDSDVEVITVFLAADEEVRTNRLDKRHGAKIRMTIPEWQEIQENEKLKGLVSEKTKEVFKRIADDKELFKLVKCDYVINANRIIEEVATDLMEVII